MSLSLILVFISLAAANDIFTADESEICDVLPKEKDIFDRFLLIARNGRTDLQNIEPNLCVFYYLYTQKNRNQPQLINNITDLKKSSFDSSKLNMVIFHGWTGSSFVESVGTVKNQTLDEHNINIIVVDWSRIALDLSYPHVAHLVKRVGEEVGEFINQIQAEYNLQGEQFLLVGHSLGGHVAGNAGAVVKNHIERIVGLDPAGPLFDNNPIRLNTTNANDVEVIHTAAGTLGIEQSIGHLDFFPNGGHSQPDCPIIPFLFAQCDHAESVNYFAESMQEKLQRISTKCDSYKKFENGECENNTKIVLGGLTRNKTENGSFFLDTHPLDRKKGNEVTVHEFIKATMRCSELGVILNKLSFAIYKLLSKPIVDVWDISRTMRIKMLESILKDFIKLLPL